MQLFEVNAAVTLEDNFKLWLPGSLVQMQPPEMHPLVEKRLRRRKKRELNGNAAQGPPSTDERRSD